MLRYEPEKVVKFANVCCALNNVLTKHKIMPTTDVDDTYTQNTDIESEIDRTQRGGRESNLFIKGEHTRRRLMAAMAVNT